MLLIKYKKSYNLTYSFLKWPTLKNVSRKLFKICSLLTRNTILRRSIVTHIFFTAIEVTTFTCDPISNSSSQWLW